MTSTTTTRVAKTRYGAAWHVASSDNATPCSNSGTKAMQLTVVRDRTAAELAALPLCSKCFPNGAPAETPAAKRGRPATVVDGHKTCAACGETKPIEEYHLHNGRPPKSRCKECYKAYAKAWRTARKDGAA